VPAVGAAQEALHGEYFSVSEAPDYVNEAFVLKLARSVTRLEAPSDKRATDILIEAGITVDMKCSDGICGVCATPILSGEVEQREPVVSTKERQQRIILCCSCAQAAGGEIVIEL
jgi:ferredoxin